jgi:leucyl/phenylalanyl-tRNA--protein transferase
MNRFVLLDTQFINDNVLRYGAIEIPRDEYLDLLKKALKVKRRFDGGALTDLSLIQTVVTSDNVFYFI